MYRRKRHRRTYRKNTRTEPCEKQTPCYGSTPAFPAKSPPSAFRNDSASDFRHPYHPAGSRALAYHKNHTFCRSRSFREKQSDCTLCTGYRKSHRLAHSIPQNRNRGLRGLRQGRRLQRNAFVLSPGSSQS